MNSLATEIVEAILSALNGRSGVGDALNDIDSETYVQMTKELVKLVKEVLKENRQN